MQYHNLIYDEEQIVKFSELFYKEIPEQYSALVYIAARSKYDSTILSQKMIDRRYINNAEQLIITVRRYCCAIGSYVDGRGNTITDKAMVVYASINLHDQQKGMEEFIQNYQSILINSIRTIQNALSSDNDKSINLNDIDNFLYNPCSKLKSSIQKYVKTKYLHIDMDSKENEHKTYFIKECGKNEAEPCYIIETMNGYHILFDMKKLEKKNGPIRKAFNKKFLIKNIPGFDYVFTIAQKNACVPLPGTLQGGFKVKFIDWNIFNNTVE